MALALIAMPFIRQERTGASPAVQKDALPEQDTPAQTWLAGALVTNTAGKLEVVPTAGVLVYGQSPDAAKGAATPAALLKPPVTLFGLNHFPFDIKDRIIEINAAAGGVIADVTGVKWGASGLIVGAKFGIFTDASAGAYKGYQTLNTGNTTNLFFEVVGLAPYQDIATTNNPRVLVKVLDAVIQG